VKKFGDTQLNEDYGLAVEEVMEEVAQIAGEILTDLGLSVQSLTPRQRKVVEEKLGPALTEALPIAHEEARAELESQILANLKERFGGGNA
jgi:hypothetical protein